MNRIEILGVPVDAVTMNQALVKANDFLQDGEKHHLMTPNSEMILLAQKNIAFKELLRSTDLNIPDSAGLLFAARRQGKRLPERVAGVDFCEKLCGSLSEKDSVFLLGGRNGAAKMAAEKLQSQYPNLSIAGTFEGSPSNADAPEIVRQINDSGATVLFVAYGAPAQDFWIHTYLMNLVSVKLAIGVGGTLDFLSGRIKRAPQLLRSMRLEWLWRLIQEPSRIGRIWNAVVVFPIKVLFSK